MNSPTTTTSPPSSPPAAPAASEVWTLSFRSVGYGPPAEIRVRRLLKAALRGYGLRCVKIGEVK